MKDSAAPAFLLEQDDAPLSSSADAHLPAHVMRQLQSVFDAQQSHFEKGASVFYAVAAIVDCLAAVMSEAGASHWLPALKQFAQAHPVAQYIDQCPCTAYSRRKPRGYAGDAVLLDFIYEHPSVQRQVSAAPAVGRSVLAHNVQSTAAAAVKNRRALLADRLTETVRRKPGARILAVASGHARELEMLEAATLAGIGEFVAFDQDRESLATVLGRDRGRLSVTGIEGTITKLIDSGYDLGAFDYIYAAGLYDYLPDRIAQRLTQRLFTRLAPDGGVLVANFLPAFRDIGYLEIFMDWSLIYRDADAIRAFADFIPANEIARSTYHTNPYRNVGYLEVTRV